jgi:hypothetical protein
VVIIGVDMDNLHAETFEPFPPYGPLKGAVEPAVDSGSLDQNTTISACFRQSSTVEYHSAMPFFMVCPK